MTGYKKFSFYVVTSIVLLGFFSVGVPLAILPAYLRETLGYGNAIIGVVIGLQSVVTLLTRHYAGSFADMRGPKTAVNRGVIINIIAGLMTYASFLVADNPSLSLVILLLARALTGWGESLLITGGLAWGVGILGSANTGRAMAWNGIAMYGAITASAPMSLIMAEHWGILSVGATMIGFPVLAWFLTRTVEPVPAAGKERVAFYKVINMVWKPGVGMALAATGFASLAGFAVLYFKSKGWEHASLIMTVFGVAYISTRLFMGHFPDKYGGLRIALISVIIEAVGQAAIWLAPNAFVALVGAALTGVGYSLVFPGFGIEAIKEVAPQNRGAAMGAYVAFFDLALGLTGPVAGLIATAFGYSAVYLWGVVGCLASVFVALSLYRVQIKPQLKLSTEP